MDKLDDFVSKRRELVERYNEAFEHITGVKIPEQVEGCNNSYHLLLYR